MGGLTPGGRNLLGVLAIVTGPIIDNIRIGPFMSMAARTINTGDTVLPHKLGRTPNGYIIYRNSSGGVVYDGSAGVSAWSPTSITLRATVAGTYSLLLL